MVDKVEITEQAALEDDRVGRHGQKSRMPRRARLLQRRERDLRAAVDMLDRITSGAPHVEPRTRHLDIGDIGGIDPAEHVLAEGVDIARLVVHHAEDAQAQLLVKRIVIGVEVGQANRVTGLVDKDVAHVEVLVLDGLLGSEENARAQLFAVVCRRVACRRERLHRRPPRRIPALQLSRELDVDTIDIAIVVRVALGEVDLLVDAAQRFMEQLGFLVVVIGAVVLRRVVDDRLRGDIEPPVRGTRKVIVQVFIGIRQIRRASAVEKRHELGVRLVGGDGHSSLATVWGIRKAHTDDNEADLSHRHVAGLPSIAVAAGTLGILERDGIGPRRRAITRLVNERGSIRVDAFAIQAISRGGARKGKRSGQHENSSGKHAQAGSVVT